MRQKVESSRMCICESIESDRSMPSTSAQNGGAVEGQGAGSFLNVGLAVLSQVGSGCRKT